MYKLVLDVKVIILTTKHTGNENLFGLTCFHNTICNLKFKTKSLVGAVNFKTHINNF